MKALGKLQVSGTFGAGRFIYSRGRGTETESNSCLLDTTPHADKHDGAARHAVGVSGVHSRLTTKSRKLGPGNKPRHPSLGHRLPDRYQLHG